MKAGSGRLRDHWRVVLLWTLVVAACMTALQQDSRLDDVAGWLLIVYVLQLPALSAAGVAAAQPAAPLPRLHAVGFSAMLALAVAYTSFALCTLLTSAIWRPAFGELRPVIAGLLAGLVALIATLVVGISRCSREPHPDAVRRCLRELALLSGALALVALAMYLANQVNRVIWFGVILPFFWMAPLWLVLPRRSPVPRAVIHSES